MDLNSQNVKYAVLQGNEACAKAAIYAGCRFYAGYPITPSTEIIEMLSEEMPKAGGAFIQMEDENKLNLRCHRSQMGRQQGYDSDLRDRDIRLCRRR